MPRSGSVGAPRARASWRFVAALLAMPSGGCGPATPARTARDDGPQGVPPSPTDDRPRAPRDYVLVGARGTMAFATLPSAATRARGERGGTPSGAGFGFVVTEERTQGGGRYVHIADGRWLPAANLTRARPSTFAGRPLGSGERLRFGWVTSPRLVVHAGPDASSPALATRPFHALVFLAGPCANQWCPLDRGFARAGDLALPRVSPRPARVGPVERWLDVELGTQTLVAYRGDEPVYATLVSTGIGGRGSALATPTGVFTIRSKHRLVRMDNLEHTGVTPYAFDVPLAQYFSDGKALHAALWHDRFGHPTSHGCVNLSPRDAEWLFAFTAPTLPRGAAEEIANEASRPGTTVQVHGEPPPLAAR